MDNDNNVGDEIKKESGMRGTPQQGDREIIVIKDKSEKSSIITLMFVLLITMGIAYLIYIAVANPPHQYIIQDVNGEAIVFDQTTGIAYYPQNTTEPTNSFAIANVNDETIIFDQTTGTAFFPQSGIKISVDEYVKKREGQTFKDSAVIPASTDLDVSSKVKASENLILYSIEFGFVDETLSGEELDSKVDSLRDDSNSNLIYLNFYDKDGFNLFNHKVQITGGTKIVNSDGYGEGLQLEGSFSEDSILIGLISSFQISWSISDI